MARLGRGRAKQRNRQTAIDVAVIPSSINITQSGSTLIGDIQTFTATYAGGGLRDTWTWSVVAAPTGDSTFSFVPANPQQLRWRPRVAGTYTLRLTITNAAGSSFTDLPVTCSEGTGTGPRWVFIVGSDTTWTTAETVVRDHMIERGHRITAFQGASSSAYTSVQLGFDAVLMSNDSDDASVGTKYASTKPFMTLSPFHGNYRSFVTTTDVYTGESTKTWTINGASPNGDYATSATPQVFFGGTINDVVSTADMATGVQVTAQDAPAFNESVSAFRVDVGSAGATNRYAMFSMRGASTPQLNRAGWDLFDDHLAWVLGSAASVDALGDLEGPVNRSFVRIPREYGLSSVTARSWKIQAGPGAGTSLGTSATLTWTPAVIGTYTLRYSVTANGGTVYTDDVTLTVSALVQSGYRYWKWQPTSIRDDVSANSMQIAEFGLFDSWSETRVAGVVSDKTVPTLAASQAYTSGSTASTTHTVTKPTGTTGRLVAFLTWDTATTTASTSSTGWSLGHTETQGTTTNHSMGVFLHDDASTAPNLVVTLSVAQNATGSMHRVTNADGPTYGWGNGGSTATITYAVGGTQGPAFDALAQNNYLALLAVGTDSNTTQTQSATFSAPFTSQISQNPTSGTTTSAATFVASGFYTNVTGITPGNVTLGAAEQWVSYLVAFPAQPVSGVYNGIAVSGAGHSSPVGQTPEYAGDGLASSKFLNFNKTTGYLHLDYGQTVSPDSYRIQTANDSTVRDPTGWDLYGSSDDAIWNLVAREVAFDTTTMRNVWTSRRSLNQVPTFDSLVDGFSASNGTLWAYGASTAYTGGALVLNNNASYTSYAVTQIAYTLINSSVVVEMTAAPTEGEAFIQLGANTADISNSGVMFQITGGQLRAYRNVAGVRTIVGSAITYSNTTHRFLRMRESGGTVFWDYSANGVAWTNLTSWVSTISLTAQYLLLGCGGGAGSSTVSYGGVNYISGTPTPPTVPNSVTSAYLRTTTAGTNIYRYEIQDSVVSGAAGQMFLYLPEGKAPGTSTKVAIIGHGWTDPAGTFWENYASGAVAALADKMADAGYACIVPEQSETFGNSDAQARIGRAYTYMATNWTVGANAAYVGFSMGGGACAVAMHKRTVPQIKTAALFSPLVNWSRFTGSESGATQLWAAYGASDKPTFLTNSAAWDPLQQPAASYNAERFRVSSSTGDNTISRSLDALPFLTIVGNAQGSQAVDYSATGDHSEAGLWANPDAVVTFLDFGISNPNSAPAQATSTVTAQGATVTKGSNAPATAATLTVAGQNASGGLRPVATAAATLTTAGQTALANVQARPTAAAITVASQAVTSAGPPKIDTLTDTFDTSISSTKWNINGTSPTVTGGRLAITPSTAYDSISSKTSYTLTSTAAYVEVPTTVNVGNGSTGQFFNLAAYNNVDDSVEIVSTGNTLFAFKWVAAVQTSLGSVTYNATNHRWWRIRESAGTTYFEAGPTSSSFPTTIATASTATLTTGGMTFAQLVVNLGAGYGGTEPSPGSPTFDNFNVGIVATNAPATTGTLTVAGQNTASSVVVNAGLASLTAAGRAATAVTTVAASATAAAVSVAAQGATPVPSIRGFPTAAALTVAGQQATVTAIAVASAPATAATLAVAGQTTTSLVSVNAGSASLGVAGQSATVLGVTRASATAATLTVAGQQASATTIATTSASATAASLAVAGQVAAASISVNAGAASLGVAAQNTTSTVLGGATAATLSIAGQNATVTTSSSASAPATAATLAVSGQNATPTSTATVTASAATLAVAGQNATKSINVAPTTAAIGLTAQTTATAISAPATAAALSVSGQNATVSISESRSATPTAATITVTGQSATPTSSTSATATAATLAVAGQLATKTVNPTTTAAPVTVAGQTASGFVSESRSATPTAASVAVAGQTTTTTNASRPAPTAATLTVSGQSATASTSLARTPTTAAIGIGGYNATVTISESRTDVPDTATLAVSAQNASVTISESRSPTATAASIGLVANNASGSSAAFTQAQAQTANITTLLSGYGQDGYGTGGYGQAAGTVGPDAKISIAARPTAAPLTVSAQNASQTRALATAATIAVAGQATTTTTTSQALATTATLSVAAQNATGSSSVSRTPTTAAVAMAGQNATVSISESRSPVATAAAVGIAAQSTKSLVSPTTTAATVAIAAANPSVTASGSTTATTATLALAGQNATPTTSGSTSATTAPVTVSAQNATISTSESRSATPSAASLGVTAQAPQASVKASATEALFAVAGLTTKSTATSTAPAASLAVAGQTTKSTVTTTSQAASVTVSAQNATVTISESRSQLATAAPVSIAGLAAPTQIAPTPTAATVGVAGQNATISTSESRSATPTAASITVAGQGASGFVIQSGSASAITAAVTVTAGTANGRVDGSTTTATLAVAGQTSPAQVSAYASTASVGVTAGTTTSTAKPTPLTATLAVAGQSVSTALASNTYAQAQTAQLTTSLVVDAVASVAPTSTTAALALTAQIAAEAISERAQTASAAISAQESTGSVSVYPSAAAVGVAANASSAKISPTTQTAPISVQAYQSSSQGTVTAVASAATLAVTAQAIDGRVSTGPTTATFAVDAQSIAATAAVPGQPAAATLAVTAISVSTSVQVNAGLASVGLAAQTATSTVSTTITAAPITVAAQGAQAQTATSAQTAALAVTASATTSNITTTPLTASVGVQAIDASIASASYVNPLAGLVELALEAQQARGSVVVHAGLASVTTTAVDASTATAAYANPAPTTATVGVTSGTPATAVTVAGESTTLAAAAQPSSTSISAFAGAASVGVSAQTSSAAISVHASGADVSISARDANAQAITRVYALPALASVDSGEAATTIRTTPNFALVQVIAVGPGSDSQQAVFPGTASFDATVSEPIPQVSARPSAADVSTTGQLASGTVVAGIGTAQFAVQSQAALGHVSIVGAARLAHIAIGADSPDVLISTSASAALWTLIASTPEALVPALIGKITLLIRQAIEMVEARSPHSGVSMTPASGPTAAISTGAGRATATISATMKKSNIVMDDATGVRRGFHG